MSVSFLDVFNQAIDRYPPIVPPQTLLAQAIAALHLKETTLDNYLLVTALGDKNSSLVGVLTEKEAVSFMAKHRDWFERPVSEAMGGAIAYQVSEITSFQQLLSLFRQYRLLVLPLIDNEGIITGTITREQIWQAMEVHFSSCGDRKCAEIPLQAIQARFEYLIASSPAVIYSCGVQDESFPATFISENIKEILGYSPQSWLQDPNFWRDRLHPEDIPHIFANLEQLFVSGHRVYEYRFLHQNGNYLWLRDEVKLIRDDEGNPIECVGSIIIIDDRKQTEVELRKSEERYRAIVQDQTELICRYRVDGTLIFVNDAYCRYFQQSRQDIIDRKWLPDIVPEDLETLNQQYSLLRPDRPVYTCEIRTFLPNGTSRIQQWIDRGFFNEQGELIEIQAVGRDISDRKQAENDIRHALEKEKELNELKSNFISIASHEFRTPLTVIMASAKLQKHYSHKLSEEQKQQQLDRLLRASDRILQLLNDILILGRAEAGKIELSLAPLNLKNFCLELLAEIEAIDENQHSIIFSNGESVDRNIIADENLLRYILTNLLSNATKYSPQNTPVTLNVSLKNCEVIFQIEDRGLGIPSEDIPHLFESFHRAKNVGEIKGTGLGLAIVKRAVALYQGAIDVQSKLNEGTTFTITLPLLPEN
ncbi:PAS domain-containing protein [Spirulina sp. 06S082]|uniref:PAS domain-containing protein n=1 Tax=Spirulina sp. 06S082 TaxID=3110248 RepID=UPI002B1F6B02|nr:PAS domain-containing protein [Spirulina sp. 06S082]MEA5470949.1 PAS domain-containing protein [Spirulina sp. 06S082]